MRKKYILFDLDGTLTDSSEGITKSVQYALDKLGITENDECAVKKKVLMPILWKICKKKKLYWIRITVWN